MARPRKSERRAGTPRQPHPARCHRCPPRWSRAGILANGVQLFAIPRRVWTYGSASLNVTSFSNTCTQGNEDRSRSQGILRYRGGGSLPDPARPRPHPGWPRGHSHHLGGMARRAMAGTGNYSPPRKTPDEFATAFAASKAPVDITFSLERVPGCDVYRAGDGVHAAWIERRSVFEPWWKVWFHRYNPKHIALIRLERGVYRTVRAVIANSRMVADEIVHWHGCPRKKIHIVPNGIGGALATADRAESRSKLGLDDGYIALFAGSGWERKGCHMPSQQRKRRMPRYSWRAGAKSRPIRPRRRFSSVR